MHQVQHVRMAWPSGPPTDQAPLLSPFDALALSGGGGVSALQLAQQPAQQPGSGPGSPGGQRSGAPHAGAGDQPRAPPPGWDPLAWQQAAARRELPGTPLGGSSRVSVQHTWPTNATASVPATPGASPTRLRSATQSPQVSHHPAAAGFLLPSSLGPPGAALQLGGGGGWAGHGGGGADATGGAGVPPWLPLPGASAAAGAPALPPRTLQYDALAAQAAAQHDLAALVQRQQLLAILGKQAPGLGLASPPPAPAAALHGLGLAAADPLGGLPCVDGGAWPAAAPPVDPQRTPMASKPPLHPFVTQQQQQRAQAPSPQQPQSPTPAGQPWGLAARISPPQVAGGAAGASQSAQQAQQQALHPWVQRQLQLQQHGLQQKLQAALQQYPAPGQQPPPVADTWTAPVQPPHTVDQAGHLGQLPRVQATADGWGVPFGQAGIGMTPPPGQAGALALGPAGSASWKAAGTDTASGWGQPFAQHGAGGGDAVATGWGAIGDPLDGAPAATAPAAAAWGAPAGASLTEQALQQQAQQPEPVQILRDGQAFIMMTDVAVVQRFWASLDPALARLQRYHPPGWPRSGAVAVAPAQQEPVIYQVVPDPEGGAVLGADEQSYEPEWPVDWQGRQTFGSGTSEPPPPQPPPALGRHFHCAACQVDLADEAAVGRHLAEPRHEGHAQPAGWGQPPPAAPGAHRQQRQQQGGGWGGEDGGAARAKAPRKRGGKKKQAGGHH